MAETHDTDADRTGLEVMFSRFKRLVWSAVVARGAAVNLRPLAEQPPHVADDLEAAVTASARIARRLTIDTTFLGRRVAERESAASILQNHIRRLKTTYQFPPELGVRVFVQQDKDRRVPQPANRGWQLFAKMSYAFPL